MTLLTITPQQQSLTNLLFSFRYISRLQFQIYLGHNNPREVNRQLQNLVEKKYIKQVKGGDEDNEGINTSSSSKPAIYCIGRNGLRFIAKLKALKMEDLKNRYKDSSYSQAFIDHQLLLTDTFLQFREGAGKKNINLIFQTKSDFEKESTLYRFSPDAYIIEEGDTKKVSLLKIIDIETPRFVLTKKIRSLFKLYLNNSLEVETGETFPTILIVCPTQELQGFLKNYITKIQQDQGEDIIFKLTTVSKVRKLGVNSKIWKGLQQ